MGFVRQNAAGIVVFSIVLGFSRLFLWQAGLAPNFETVLHHWQHGDFALFDTDYWRSLWYLHAQPPLWNALIGGAVNLTWNDSAPVTHVLHGLFIGLSWICGVIFIRVFRHLGAGPWAAAGFATAFLVSPSVLYYENFIFYPHFTFFLVALLVLSLLAFSRWPGPWRLAFVMGILCLMAWTWAIFHPLFVVLTGALLVGYSALRQRALGAAIVLAAGVFAALPAVKNAVVFDTPSASSWFGMNIARTVYPRGSEAWLYCDFYPVHLGTLDLTPEESGFDYPSLNARLKSSGHENLNHIAFVGRGRECLSMAVTGIAAHPWDYTVSRFDRLFKTHKQASFDYYDDFNPRGWELFAPVEAFIDAIPADAELLHVLMILFLVFGLLRSVKGDDRVFYAALCFLIVYFTLVSHFGNNEEQQRMRYTLGPAYAVLCVGLALDLTDRLRSWFGRGRRARQE